MIVDEGLRRLCEKSLGSLTTDAALSHLGQLIDASADAGHGRGFDRALRQLDELSTRVLSPKQAVVSDYFRANAHNGKRRLAGDTDSWAWEQIGRQEELLALSRATSNPGFAEIEPLRRCQILTNRGTLLLAVGRFIDAVESWDAALRIDPRFAMAHGNRAAGLKHYALSLPDQAQRAMFLLHAHDAAASAISPDAFYDCAYPPTVRAGFEGLAHELDERLPLSDIRFMMHGEVTALGRGKAERSYRRWCLAERLFLNPLNDLVTTPIAARDVLLLPGLTVDIRSRREDAGVPEVIGLFNQLKQEYASARFSLYEGLTASGVHYSDRGVLLSNTLDYPTYSLAMERVRTSYRVAYSLLDKIGFLVNAYWELGKNLDSVNFRNVWLEEGSKRLLQRFAEYENWPLRGLFWLSKEIFDPQLNLVTNPDARALHEIRNHLEHKYLRTHEAWAWPALDRGPVSSGLAKGITDDDLEAKALRVMRIARSALIHACLAIAREERLRAGQGRSEAVISMPVTEWMDSWKRRR